MDSFSVEKKKGKVIFVMGATATGKSRLSIDLANRFPAEIINSDKIQVYKGLDIVTNKITEAEKQSVPHHLLGEVDDPDSDFTALQFCYDANSAVAKIVDSGKVPIIVGGSNSFLQALVEDPVINFKSRYDCCFIWLYVALPVHFAYICKRVDQMVDAGLVEEVRGIFDRKADYGRGIRRAIGVPELDEYFRSEMDMDVPGWRKEILLSSAIQEIKDNTCELARRQIGKIQGLKEERGWAIDRIDATAVFEKSGKGAETEIAWERHVLQPCTQKVTEFLYDDE